MATAGVQSDLKMLPLRALLAYATRCARRVQPLYAIDPSHADAAECIAAIDTAIGLAEAFAAGQKLDDEVLLQAEEGVVKALTAANEGGADDEKAAYAANAAYAVIDAVLAALDVPDADDPAEAARKVVDSATIATDAARAADKNVQRAARLDWEMLHRMHLGRYPDLGEPIDPSQSGILGPLFCLQTEQPANGRAQRRAEARTRRREEAQKPARSEPAAPAKQAETPKAEAAPPASAFAPEDISEPDEAPILSAAKANGAAKSVKIRSWIDRLQKQQQELESQQASLRAERALLQSELESFQLARDEFVTERELFRAQQSQPGTSGRSSAAEDQQGHEELARLQAELAERQSRIEADRKALAEERAQIAARQAELDRGQQEVAREQARLEEATAALERERGELNIGGQQQEHLQQRCDELQKQIEKLHAELAADPPELAELRQKYEAGLKQFQKEQERLEADRKKFQAEQATLRTERATFETERKQFQQDKVGTSGKVAELQKERAAAEQEREALQAERARLDEERAAQSQQRDRLREEAETLRQDRAQFESQQAQLSRELTALEKEREEFHDQVEQLREGDEELTRLREQLQAERRSIESLSKDAGSGRQQIAQVQAQLDRERIKLDELRRQLETQQSELQAEREGMLQERRTHQKTAEDIERERASLLEERAGFARRESDLLKTISDLKQSNDAARPGATENAAAAELKSEVERLRAEQQTLHAERDRLAEQLRRGNAAASMPASPAATTAAAASLRDQPSDSSDTDGFEYTGPIPKPVASAPPLRILVQRGKAVATELGALLSELTRLYQRLGGHGLCFRVVDCRTRRRAADAKGRGAAPPDDRSYVEVHLRPSAAGDAAENFNAGAWDQFRSCLCMCMRLDAGLGEGFENGETAAKDHPVRELIAEAIARAYAADAAHRQAMQTGAGTALKIDSVHQQLQRVEHVLRSLERQRFLGIELTPIVEVDQDAGAERTGRRWLPRITRRRLLLVAAGVLAIAGGLHYLGIMPGL